MVKVETEAPAPRRMPRNPLESATPANNDKRASHSPQPVPSIKPSRWRARKMCGVRHGLESIVRRRLRRHGTTGRGRGLTRERGGQNKLRWTVYRRLPRPRSAFAGGHRTPPGVRGRRPRTARRARRHSCLRCEHQPMGFARRLEHLPRDLKPRATISLVSKCCGHSSEPTVLLVRSDTAGCSSHKLEQLQIGHGGCLVARTHLSLGRHPSPQMNKTREPELVGSDRIDAP